MAVVECYAGAVYPERPRAFTWQGQRYQVTVVRRQWREQGTDADSTVIVFEVEGEPMGGGRGFVLRYTPAADSWEIIPL